MIFVLYEFRRQFVGRQKERLLQTYILCMQKISVRRLFVFLHFLGGKKHFIDILSHLIAPLIHLRGNVVIGFIPCYLREYFRLSKQLIK